MYHEDFLYKGVFDENAPPDLADLLEIMELSNYWGIPSLQEKTQYCIIPLITPLTVTESKIYFSLRNPALTIIAQSKDELRS